MAKSSGGKRSNIRSACRIFARRGSFSLKAEIVARPMAVRPTSWNSSHSKCSVHECCRGGNSGTVLASFARLTEPWHEATACHGSVSRAVALSAPIHTVLCHGCVSRALWSRSPFARLRQPWHSDTDRPLTRQIQTSMGSISSGTSRSPDQKRALDQTQSVGCSTNSRRTGFMWM